MRPVILLGALTVAVGTLGVMDGQEEGVLKVQDSLSRCLSAIEQAHPIEGWEWAHTGDEKVTVRYTSRIRGGLVQRKATCKGGQVIRW